jgi:membrane protease YdiL (CAAX protease family)
LPLLALLHAYLVWRDQSDYATFKTFSETADRQATLRKWVAESVFFYGILPLAVLIAVGQFHALFEFPAFLLPLSDWLRSSISSDGGFLNSVLSGMAMAVVPVLLVGHTVFTLGRVYVESKRRFQSRNPVLDVRDVEALFPRNRDERIWTAALSISAGINEELCFRLVIPFMLFVVTGSPVTAVVLATIWFGLAHLYQGWFGVVATFVLGSIFFFIYLLTQNIWLAMLIHTVLDLNDLAFAPWYAEWLEKRRITTP